MTYIRPMLLSLLLVFTAASANAETIDDLVLRNGSYYKKFSDTPYNRKISGEVNTSFTNGQLNGPWLKYHKNGQLFEKGAYETGKKTGFWEYFTTFGTLKTTEFWKVGVKVPFCQSDGDFHNCYGTYVWGIGNKYVGDWQDGKIHGQGTYTSANGSKWVGSWENGKLNGYAITYYADGSINKEGIFKDNVFIKKGKLMKKD